MKQTTPSPDFIGFFSSFERRGIFLFPNFYPFQPFLCKNGLCSSNQSIEESFQVPFNMNCHPHCRLHDASFLQYCQGRSGTFDHLLKCPDFSNLSSFTCNFQLALLGIRESEVLTSIDRKPSSCARWNNTQSTFIGNVSCNQVCSFLPCFKLLKMINLLFFYLSFNDFFCICKVSYYFKNVINSGKAIKL